MFEKSSIISAVSVFRIWASYIWEVAMFKKISKCIWIIDLLLVILLLVDRAVKSMIVIAAITFIISAILQLMMSYKNAKITTHLR